MRRRALRLLLFLLVAMTTNIAVAWVGASTVDVKNAAAAKVTLNSAWRAIVWRSTLGTRVYIFTDQLYWMIKEPPPLVPLELPWWGPQDISEYRTSLIPFKPPVREAYGWPMRCLWSEYVYEQGRWIPHGGLGLNETVSAGPNGWPITPVLPVQFVPTAFAINTIFYAAIVWMIFAIPGAVRRRLRHKRGQCAACGYSLHGTASEKCPECGTKLGHPQMSEKGVE